MCPGAPAKKSGTTPEKRCPPKYNRNTIGLGVEGHENPRRKRIPGIRKGVRAGGTPRANVQSRLVPRQGVLGKSVGNGEWLGGPSSDMEPGLLSVWRIRFLQIGRVQRREPSATRQPSRARDFD